MSRIIRRKPSAAMAVALVALFVALGGSALAATIITSNSQVGDNTINSRNVVDGSLTGADVAESKLGQVPSAKTAGSAPIRGYQVVRADAVLNPARAVTAARVACPAGKKVLGGGAVAFGVGVDQSIVTSAPVDDVQWSVEMRNDSATAANFVVVATCANAP